MPPRTRGRGRTIRKHKSSGATGKMRRRVFKRGGAALSQRVTQLYKMIETKEYTRRVVSTPLAKIHVQQNNVNVLDINPFLSSIDGLDPMAANTGSRIGDSIAVRGVMIKGFLENAFQRSKVYWRIMVMKCAKGDVPTRATLFRGSSDNKMIDQINTERYTILAQKIFNITSANATPSNADAAGVPVSTGVAGIATKTFHMYIPGRKFGRGGIVNYENQSTSQVKFYDYRIVMLCYDWWGTPQDLNNIGLVNEVYTKVYFKDA